MVSYYLLEALGVSSFFVIIAYVMYLINAGFNGYHKRWKAEQLAIRMKRIDAQQKAVDDMLNEPGYHALCVEVIGDTIKTTVDGCVSVTKERK